MLAAALLSRGGARAALLGAVAGLASHLLRDLATGEGLPLLWPASRHDLAMPYAAYAVAVAVLAVVGVLLGRPEGGRGLRTRPGARRPSEPPAAT